MSTITAIAALLGGAGIIAKAGGSLAKLANQLAQRTGLGGAFFGLIFLGGVTSLSGSVASVSAAISGYPELAVGNAIGGIAAQTTFLAIADICYPKANLEHASASLENIVSAVVLVGLLAMVLWIAALPEIDFIGVHPGSLALTAAYFMGMRLVRRAGAAPNWHPRVTAETEADDTRPETETEATPLGRLWLGFAALAGVVGVTGHVVARAAMALVERTGVSETVVGVVCMALATSLPELVTAIAAVRQGALRLAVGDILGGNCFDILLVVSVDVAYRQGSILHATAPPFAVLSLSILLTAILLLGLLQRETHGIANIGFESFLMLLVYLGGVLLMSFG